MKLRYLANARLPTEKAHGIQIMSMCKALALAGAAVELVIPEGHNAAKEDPFEYYGIPKTFSIRRIPALDLTRFAKVLGPLPYVMLSYSFAKSARKDARDNPADVYYCRDEFAFINLSLSGLPTVFEVHTMPGNMRRYAEAFEKCIAVIAISKGIKNDLVKAGVEERIIIVAHDGADITKFSRRVAKEDARKILSIDVDKRIALYTGQMYPWKGVDTLIEASASLPFGSEVVMVGGGAGRERELRERAKNIGARASFAGQVPHSDIPLYLAAADVVVIPTSGKERIGSHYTSPLKLFEAMAAGKAIVASDLPSSREILDETCAAFFTPDDSASLKSVLESVLRDSRLSAKLGSTARDRSLKYDWKLRAAFVLDNIRRLDRTL